MRLDFRTSWTKLADINNKIVKLEKKKTVEYRKTISESLAKANETLQRHEKSKPAEVSKPEQKDVDKEYQEKLSHLNKSIQETKDAIKNATDRIAEINIYINDIQTVVAQISLLQTQFGEVQNQIEVLVKKYRLEHSKCTAELITPKAFLEDLIEKGEKEKKLIQDTISAENGFSHKIESLEAEKDALISSADTEEKLYQKYLADLTEWDEKRSEIIGNKDTDGSIEFSNRN